jgi:hypothetical protein
MIKCTVAQSDVRDEGSGTDRVNDTQQVTGSRMIDYNRRGVEIRKSSRPDLRGKSRVSECKRDLQWGGTID